jgi:hypothetical protein
MLAFLCWYQEIIYKHEHIWMVLERMNSDDMSCIIILLAIFVEPDNNKIAKSSSDFILTFRMGLCIWSIALSLLQT